MSATVHYKNPPSNFVATADPAVGDDNTEGYVIGSLWFNVTDDRAYVALDVSTGAADWKEISVPENHIKSVNAGVVASTTQSQGQAPQTLDVIQVSVVANIDDVITLPTALAGQSIFIKNDGANKLQIFPASGDDIDGTGVDSSVILAAGSSVRYFAYDATNWTS